MTRLTIRDRDGTLSNVELGAERLTIGRAETCDIVLRNDAEVSREHAFVWVDDEGLVLVQDRNSKNGTRVDNGDVFRNATRAAEVVIRIGEHELQITGARHRRPSGPVEFAADPPPSHLSYSSYYPASKRVDLSQQRLTQFMNLAERIGGVFDRKQLLEQTLEICSETLGFERGLIALKTQRGDPELPVVRNVGRDENGAYKVSRTLINRAIVHGERAVVNNPATDLVANLSESLVRFPILSALCVPILNRDEILGVIYGDRVTQAHTYTGEDVDFLAALARQVGVGLANLRLFQEHVRSQKVYAELEQARDIQQNLVPSQPLELGRVRVEGYNKPSSAVGGDYFDYFALGDGRIGYIIADVTGHGLPAALVMANLQAAVRVALTAAVPLPDLAEQLNRLMCCNTSTNVFVTAILGTVNSETGHMDYVSAGHPAPILLCPDQPRLPLGENSLPLGIDENEKYEVQTIHAATGHDALLFYTDGLVEAADPQGRILDLPPVMEGMRGLSERTPEAVIGHVLRLVQQHLDGGKAQDDLTLMAMHLK